MALKIFQIQKWDNFILLEYGSSSTIGILNLIKSLLTYPPAIFNEWKHIAKIKNFKRI